MIPSRVYIDGMEWNVVMCDGLSDMGQCDPGNLEIRISTRIKTDMQESTFWHEVIHALKATRDLPDEMGEEDIAKMYGAALCSFLNENADIEWRI